MLARPAVGWLGVRSGGVYVDATFGAGGYTRAILATPGARVIGIDRDPDRGRRRRRPSPRKRGIGYWSVEDRFSDLEAVL